jgi:hypothetical protein
LQQGFPNDFDESRNRADLISRSPMSISVSCTCS